MIWSSATYLMITISVATPAWIYHLLTDGPFNYTLANRFHVSPVKLLTQMAPACWPSFPWSPKKHGLFRLNGSLLIPGRSTSIFGRRLIWTSELKHRSYIPASLQGIPVQDKTFEWDGLSLISDLDEDAFYSFGTTPFLSHPYMSLEEALLLTRIFPSLIFNSSDLWMFPC